MGDARTIIATALSVQLATSDDLVAAADAVLVALTDAGFLLDQPRITPDEYLAQVEAAVARGDAPPELAEGLRRALSTPTRSQIEAAAWAIAKFRGDAEAALRAALAVPTPTTPPPYCAICGGRKHEPWSMCHAGTQGSGPYFDTQTGKRLAPTTPHVEDDIATS